MVRCPDARCGLLWLNPMPMSSDIGKAYTNYFTHDGGDHVATTSWLRIAYRRLLHRLDTLTGMASELRKRDRLYLPQSAVGKLLEIGCGRGELLNDLRSSGWEVSGIDFDKKAVDAAARTYGLNLKTGDVLEAGYPSETFDFVVMQHVLEHLPDPVVTLKECFRLLKSGGVFISITPNTESLGLRWFKRDWLGLDPPRHLFLYNRLSLTSLARRAGFTSLNVFSTYTKSSVVFWSSLDLRLTGTCSFADSGARPLRSLQSRILQYVESTWTIFRKEVGEELVLIAHKQ